jgi:hypothetical protein
VATLKVDVRDSSSQVVNQTHANQMIVVSGAVRSLASELLIRVSGIEIPARPPQPRNQRRPTSARSVSIAGDVRFARLCVLIEPNPARRSVHQDLDRILHLLQCRAPSLLIGSAESR